MGNEISRRIDIKRNTPAELAIREAVHAVEMTGAHPLLTDAVILLDQARGKVADYVDGNFNLSDLNRIAEKKYTSEKPERLRRNERLDCPNDCDSKTASWKDGDAYCPKCGEMGCVYERKRA